MLLLLEGHEFNLVAAVIGIALLLVLSIPVGFLVAFGLRKWHERHPIEKDVEDEKHPLGLQ